MLDFRIETFLCACKYMNFTKAAQELGITQPGVSQHIKYLEGFYGDKLFTYSNKLLHLTPTGEQLRDAMLSIKHDNIHLRKQISDHAQAQKSIKFGATLTIGEFMLPANLIYYLKKNDSVQVTFIIANTQRLLSSLEEGSIDFAIIEGYFQKNEYEFRTISNERYLLVCGNDYPLEYISNFYELFTHNLIVREDGSGTKEILERYLLDRGYSFTDFSSTSTVSSIHVIKQLVENNCGITFIYEIAVKKELEEGTLREIKLPGADLLHEFNYIWRKNSVFRDYYLDLYESFF
ncbi:MAG: LysR family transcriptional regulator [Velocimicrobium sp.]